RRPSAAAPPPCNCKRLNAQPCTSSLPKTLPHVALRASPYRSTKHFELKASPAGACKPFLPTVPSPSPPKGPASPLPAPAGPNRRRRRPRNRRTPMNDDVSRARAESAALLNLNPDELSPAAALKCDLVSALRAVLDDELAKATSGSGADLNRLVVAVEHLVGFLKEANPAKADDGIPAIYQQDPRKVLEGIVERWIAAEEAERAERGLSGLMPDLRSAQARIDELEAELAALRNALPAPDGAERSRTPDDLKAMRPKPTIDGEAVPQTGPTDAEREANRQRINNDRSFEHRIMTQPIGRNAPQPSGPRMPQPDNMLGGFHWGGSKGRAWRTD